MHWHHTPQAQAILTRINPASLTTATRNDAIRPDRYTRADERTEAKLEQVRRDHATATVGYTFESTQEPFDAEACGRWLEALGPSVETVLVELSTSRVELGRAA